MHPTVLAAFRGIIVLAAAIVGSAGLGVAFRVFRFAAGID